MEEGLGNREIKNEQLTATVLKNSRMEIFQCAEQLWLNFYNVIYLHVVDSTLTYSYTPVKV